MPEETKPPVEGQDTGKVKTTEEAIAELKVKNEEIDKLKKQIKDKDEFAGRLSNEVGELRKKVSPENKNTETEEKDELKSRITGKLREKGLDEETAKYNADIMKDVTIEVLNDVLGKRAMEDLVEYVQDDFDEKKMDKAIYDENETEILSEFKSRKLSANPKRNLRIMRDCYDIVTRRKAETLRTQKEKEDAEKRDKEIAAGNQPPSGGQKPPASDEDKKIVDAIRNAGSNRGSAFF